MKRLLFVITLMLSVAGLKAQTLKVAPDFTLNTADGKAITLSQYVQGKKVVLIDFWASWCVPCRKEGKNIKAIYADYSNKGFNVLGVSMDNDAAKWKKAIAEEAYPWAQVSDLQAFKSPIAKKYQLTMVPCLYLVDSNLNVIAVNLRGDALRTKIAEICK